MTSTSPAIVLLDAMVFQYPDWPLVQELMRHEGEQVRLLVGRSVLDELAHPLTPRFVRERAARIAPAETKLTPVDRKRAGQIARLLAGSGDAGRHAGDGLHLVEAARAGARWFLTRDRKILEHREALWRELGVMPCPPEALLDRIAT